MDLNFSLLMFSSQNAISLIICDGLKTNVRKINKIKLSFFYLATAKNAKSTFKPVFADVSINVTLYSRARRSPSSRFTSRSQQSALLPDCGKTKNSQFVCAKCTINPHIYKSSAFKDDEQQRCVVNQVVI